METKIPDNKNEVPLEHYLEQFSETSPRHMAEKSGFEFDEANSSFKMRFIGTDICVKYPEMRVYKADGEEIATPSFRILMGRALMEGMYKKSGGTYLAYSEVPWGTVYLQQFKGRCILRLAFGFGFNLAKFEKACLAIGGKPCSGGDKGFEIEFLNGLSVKLLLWAGDDEFPPSSQILFSDNFPAMFTAEDLAFVGDNLINALKAVK